MLTCLSQDVKSQYQPCTSHWFMNLESGDATLVSEWGVYLILWFKRNVYTILIPRDKSPFQNSDDLNISAVRPRLPEALCIALLFLALSKKT